MLAMILFVIGFCLTTGSLQQENRKLEKENSSLLRLLRELTTDAEKEVGSGPSSFNAERAVGGYCTPDELADGCSTKMLTVATSIFPVCECLDAEKEVGSGPSSFNAERAVGHGGDCTTVEITHGCSTMMMPLGVSMFPKCVCLETKVGETKVGQSWLTQRQDSVATPAVIFPSECYEANKESSLSSQTWNTFDACDGGAVLVAYQYYGHHGEGICCPLDVWRTFRY